MNESNILEGSWTRVLELKNNWFSGIKIQYYFELLKCYIVEV